MLVAVLKLDHSVNLTYERDQVVAQKLELPHPQGETTQEAV